MSDDNRDTLSLQDEDRLPWLEAVDDEESEGSPIAKLVGIAVAALVAIGLTVSGVLWLRSQNTPAPQGDPKLIAAAEGDYKVKPDEPGGMKVEGQGDAAFAASEGQEANGQLDPNQVPETPVAGTRAANATPPEPRTSAKSVATAVPASGGKLAATPPAKVSGAPMSVTAPAGSVIQLGAFNSEAVAKSAWGTLSKRFAFLAPLPNSIERATVGGSTVYRLRANAGPQAGGICGKLKVAGENCMVVN